MNIFTDLVFIFVFVFVLLHFEVIKITESNVVTQKLYMFLAVTAFASMLNIMKAIRKQYVIRMWDVISSGLIIGMLAFIGHTLMFDLFYMKETRPFMDSVIDWKAEYITPNVILSLFICGTIAVGRSMSCIFNTDICN